MLIVSVVISTRDTRLNHFFLSICNSHSLGHISSEAASLFVFDHFAGFCFSEGDAGKIKQKGHRSGAVVEPDSCGHVAAQRECPIAGAQSLNCRYTRPMVVVVRGHKNWPKKGSYLTQLHFFSFRQFYFKLDLNILIHTIDCLYLGLIVSTCPIFALTDKQNHLLSNDGHLRFTGVILSRGSKCRISSVLIIASSVRDCSYSRLQQCGAFCLSRATHFVDLQ